MKRPSPAVSRLLWCSLALTTGITGWSIGRYGRDENAASADRHARNPGLRQPASPAKEPAKGSLNAVEVNSAAAAVLKKASPGVVNAALLQEMNAALEEPDTDTRTAKWTELLAAMRKEDAIAVRGIFLDNDQRGRWFIPEWIVFWKKFGELDSLAALDEWNATGNHADQDSPGRIIAAGIKARGDAEVQKLMARDDVKGSPQRMKEVIKACALQGSNQSTKLMMDETLPESFRSTAAQAIVEAGIDQGGLEKAPDIMQRLVSAGAPEQTLQSAFAALISAAGRGGPERLQEVALEQVNQPWCTGQALMSVTAHLGSKDPVTALDFIAKLPPTHVKESIEVAVELSSRSNPETIGLWLKEHRSTPHYDNVTAAYCRSIRSVDPSAAEAWAKTIKDPALRATALPPG